MSTFIAILVTLALLALLQRLLETKRGSEAAVKLIAANARPVAWNFVAMEYCYGILNRTFVVFVTDNMICAARVRGVLPVPLSVGSRWHDPYFYPKPNQMKRYIDVNLESKEFLASSWANFQVPKQDLLSVVFGTDEKWGMGSVPYSGRIFLLTKGGMKKELILLGTQSGKEIGERLAAGIAPRLAA